MTNRERARVLVVAWCAACAMGCGATSGPPTASTASSADTEVEPEVAASSIELEPDRVSCASDRVASPSQPRGGCTPGASTYVAVHRRLRELLPELASSCAGGGELVLRFAIDAEGRVESPEIVSSTVETGTASRALALISTVEHCPPEGGERTVITYPLILR